MANPYKFFEEWEKDIDIFLEKCNKNDVRMLMVGGGAVNFYGYQRHSADVDFWIEVLPQNLLKLKNVLFEMGFDMNEFPKDVYEKKQNISLKFSPTSPTIELITNFSSYISFDKAFNDSELVNMGKNTFLRWRVISYEDLIDSKIRAGRPKDLLDVMELKRINEEK